MDKVEGNAFPLIRVQMVHVVICDKVAEVIDPGLFVSVSHRCLELCCVYFFKHEHLCQNEAFL
jgi:hypothetical protein